MSVETSTNERIGPDVSLAEIELPSDVGDGLAALFGTDDRLRDGAEWLAAIDAAFADSYETDPTVDDLCTSADGVHTFVGDDGSQSYICVLDPLAYPFITGETGTVRSETPVRGETVTFEIREDGVDVTPMDAVVSIGVSDHIDQGEELTLETVYRQSCGFIHAFVDQAEYETWAANAEAATTSLPAAEGIAVARGIATGLFGGAETPDRAAE